MIRAAIFGASGYTGVELARLVMRHRHIELVLATTRSMVGESMRRVHPTAPDVVMESAETADLSQLDVAFLCLPHAASAPTAVRLLEAGVRVVDLSADFRLNDVQTYQKWYGIEHPAPDLLDEAVYGLVEHSAGGVASGATGGGSGLFSNVNAAADAAAGRARTG